MATYSNKTFNTNHYNNARPNYPDSYYETLMDYHKGNKDLAIDVGCGSGFVAFKLTDFFNKVVGTDISEVMIEQCNSTKTSDKISFKVCPGEKLTFEDNSIDMVASAEALHWVNTDEFFKEAYRILKPGGTLSFWFYKEPTFEIAEANELYDEFAFGPNHLGPYWEQPGKNRLRNMLRDVDLSKDGFKDIIRKEFDPLSDNPDFLQPTTLKISKIIDLNDFKEYLTSWSAYHSWKLKNDGNGKKDIVDQFISELEPIFGKEKFTATWATVYTLARK